MSGIRTVGRVVELLTGPADVPPNNFLDAAEPPLQALGSILVPEGRLVIPMLYAEFLDNGAGVSLCLAGVDPATGMTLGGGTQNPYSKASLAVPDIRTGDGWSKIATDPGHAGPSVLLYGFPSLLVPFVDAASGGGKVRNARITIVEFA